MSLGDLLSTGRGPGFIGMLLALVVLAGFGLLYLAIAEVEESEGHGVAAIVSSQAEDLEIERIAVEGKRVQLEAAPLLEEISAKYEEVKKGAPERTEKISKLRQEVAVLENSLKATATAFTSYKDSYRSDVRAKAVGEQLDQLVLKSGSIYKKVEIREVSAIGMQIRHEDGQKRVAYEELPDQLQQRFQFDGEQKDRQLALELENLKRHEGAVETPDVGKAVPLPGPGKETAGAATDSPDEKVRQQSVRRAINDIQIKIAKARADYTALIAEASIADSDAAEGRRSKMAVVNKASGIRSRMQAKQSEISGLMRQLSVLKSSN